ncbi:RND family transporter [candidate division WOR-3 bacterium]|nr:RND family transporter [candidate division WOR-3 bacterium]
MLEKLTKWVSKYPKTVITVVILLTVFFYFGLAKITIVTDPKTMLPEGDPVVAAFDEVDETFGGAEFAMVMLNMGEVFTTNSLHEIDRLTLSLERVKGVSSVWSITNMEEIRGVEGGIEVVELIEEIPTSEAELQKLKNRVLSDDDYAGQIVSRNGKIALVLIQLLPNVDRDNLIHDIKEIVQKLGLDEKAYLTGEPVMGPEIDKMVRVDMSRLLPIAILVMIAILFFSFRNIRGVVLPILIVIVTVIWTLGLMGYVGVPLSAIGNIIPIIIISMGIADGIHILARYREELSLGFDKWKALTTTIGAVGLACFLTSITTMIGFGSLYTSSLRTIKDFGLFTAIGVGIAFIITVTLFLAFLSLLRPDKGALDKKRRVFLKGILGKWADFIVGRAKIVLVAAGLLTLLGIVGIPLMSTESDFMNFFKPDSPVRSAYNTMKENFGGVEFIQVAVKGNIQDPKVLQTMEDFQNEIEKIEILIKPTSVVNLLRKTNKALHEGESEYEILPETEEEVAQYLLLLSLGGSDQLDNMLSFDYDQALIQAKVSTYKSLERDKMIGEVEKAIEKHFSSHVLEQSEGDDEVVLTGSPVVDARMLKLMVKGQLQSLALAILCIFIIMVILSRSITYGTFCAIPVSITVILNFGIMGWFKIPLDVASAVIASVAIGIGIDYAIHFFNRYKEELAIGKSVEEALRITISNTGQAIFYNAIAVGLGFLVLIFASMPPMQRFGWLIALTMFFSSTASMTVLPALLFLRDRHREKKETWI